MIDEVDLEFPVLPSQSVVGAGEVSQGPGDSSDGEKTESLN